MSVSGVSIIICCYNSQSRLQKTLQHVADMQLGGDLRLELVLVDNCCTDGTVQLVQQWHCQWQHKLQLQVVREPRPGLTSARIAGVKAAEFETLIFCDDDNWLAANYCDVAHQLLQAHPRVALAGGCSYAVPEITPPDWFWPLSGAWAVGDSDYCGLLSGPDAFVRGAGMVVRRSAFLELLQTGFQFITSDRRGCSLNSGGDAEICRELARLGYELYFDSRLSLQHWIPKERLTRSYALRLWQGFGAGTIAGDADRIVSHPHQVWKNTIRLSCIYQCFRCLLNLGGLLGQHPLWHRQNPAPALRWCSMYGRFQALRQLGRTYRKKIENRVQWIASIEDNSAGRALAKFDAGS
jgi:glycosyltransferase involved in cell wall biosynthesis